MSKIKDLLKSKGRLSVQATDKIDEIRHDESVISRGMRFDIVSVGLYEIKISFNGYDDYNDPILPAVWYNENTGNYDLTAKEGGYWPKDGKESLYTYTDILDELDEYFILLDEYNISLYDEWKNENSDKTYLNWLEDKVVSLIKPKNVKVKK